MRSQLFGFVVAPRVLYEMLTDCPMQQAVAVMQQHLVDCGVLIPTFPAPQPKLIHYLNDPLTVGMEVFLNDWDEETVHLVNSILNADDFHKHEWLRMEALRRALGWQLPNFRETCILAHFVFSTTIDEETLLTVTVGWNSAADPEKESILNSLMPVFLHRIETLGYEMKLIVGPGREEPQSDPPKPRKHGPRLETLEKLQNLVNVRQRHLDRKRVHINRLQACEQTGLAPATVKRHAPRLYERWYDPAFEGALG